MSAPAKSHDPFRVEELKRIWKMCFWPLMLSISVGIWRGSASSYLCASFEHGCLVTISRWREECELCVCCSICDNGFEVVPVIIESARDNEAFGLTLLALRKKRRENLLTFKLAVA
ncbi:hypothetical protein Tco_0789387 [Tanacetum coccineum]